MNPRIMAAGTKKLANAVVEMIKEADKRIKE